MKKQNGITLIALVITIIVMLILVGVSVTVALNGGLFTTTEQAKTKTQVELEKEQLLEMALGAMGDNGKIVISNLDAAIAADDKFTGEDGTYTSTKTGNVYTVGERGTIDDSTASESQGWAIYTVKTESGSFGRPIYILANTEIVEAGGPVYGCVNGDYEDMSSSNWSLWNAPVSGLAFDGDLLVMGNYPTGEYMVWEPVKTLSDEEVQL